MLSSEKEKALMKSKTKRAGSVRSSINISLIRIEVRRWKRARLGLDPSGPGPSFELTLHQILEGSRELAKERLGHKKEPTWLGLLNEHMALCQALKNLPKDGKIEMLTVGSKGNGSLRRVRPGQIGRLGSKAASNLVRHFPKSRKSRSA